MVARCEMGPKIGLLMCSGKAMLDTVVALYAEC